MIGFKNVEQFIDKNIVESKEKDGIFENIHDPNKIYEYLKKLLNTAKIDIQLLLSPMSLMYIVKNREIYDLLLEKSKQPGINTRIALPYAESIEPYISRLKKESNNTFKVQYLRHEERLNRMVLLVDNKYVLSISLTINESREVLESAIYSDKESIVLCYINIIEYQSLISEM